MSIDAGDRWVEYEIKEREQVGRYMYDHREDYVSRSRYEKIVDQLTKAKELLEKLLITSCNSDALNLLPNCSEVLRVRVKAEQFLSEVEK